MASFASGASFTISIECLHSFSEVCLPYSESHCVLQVSSPNISQMKQ